MRMYSRMTVVIAAAVCSLTIALPAHARTEGACKEDVKKLCGDVKPGGGAIRDCLKQHQADLSPACKDNIVEAKAKFKEKAQDIKAACKQDLQTYCANVTPGQGREMACLRAYGDKLSAGCKETLPKPGMHKGMAAHGKDGADHDESHPDGK